MHGVDSACVDVCPASSEAALPVERMNESTKFPLGWGMMRAFPNLTELHVSLIDFLCSQPPAMPVKDILKSGIASAGARLWWKVPALNASLVQRASGTSAQPLRCLKIWEAESSYEIGRFKEWIQWILELLILCKVLQAKVMTFVNQIAEAWYWAVSVSCNLQTCQSISLNQPVVMELPSIFDSFEFWQIVHGVVDEFHGAANKNNGANLGRASFTLER